MSSPKIEGKLTSKVLGELLKRLETNRGAAYLLVSDGISERCLYCSVGAIRLTSMGRRRAFRLEEKLLDHPRVTPEIVAAARQRAKETGESFEEVLAVRFELNEVVKECSSAIVRDEVLDLLLWEGASFEYADSNPPPKIFDRSLEAVKLSLGATKLLKEAGDNVNRTQRLLSRVTGRTRVSQGPAYSPPHPGDGPAASQILSSVPAEGIIFDDLVLECRRAGFDALHFTDAFEPLLESRRLEVPKKEKGTGLSKEEELAYAKRDCLDIEAALEHLINEIAARQRLARGYMALGDQARAVFNLKKVGDELFQRNRAEDAIEVYRQIIQFTPHDFGVREKVVFLLEKMKKIPEAIGAGVELARLYKQFGLFNRAKNAWRRLIGLDPEQVEHRKELIDLLVKLKQREEAVAEFENLAALYAQRQQQEEVLGVYHHLLAIDPNHQIAKRQMVSAVRARPGFWIPYAAVGAGFLALIAAGLYVSSEYRAIVDFRETRDRAFERYDADDYPGAVATVDEFLKRHGSRGAADKAKVLKTQLSELDEERRVRRGGEEYGRARELEGKGLYPQAREKYVRLLSSAKGTRWESEAQERIRDIDRLQEQAEQAVRTIRGLEEAQKFREAFERGRELVRKLHWTDAAQRHEARVEVLTTPAGARVTIDGRLVQGTTPMIVPCRIASPFTLAISLAGFAQEVRTYDVRDPKADIPYPFAFELKRNIRWRRVLLGPVEAPPLVEDDAVFVGGRDQRVYALAADGQIRWVRPLGLFADVAARPLRAGARIVVGDRTGGVTALDAARGEVLWRARLRGVARPLAARGGGDVVAVADEEGAVVGLDGASGKERWRVRAPGGLAAVPVYSELDGTIVAPCRESILLVLDAATGAEKARVPTQARPAAPPATSGGGFVVAIEGDEVHSISREGKIAWRARVPGTVAGAPLVADGAAFVGAGSSLVALDLANGQERFPRRSYGARIRATPAIGGDTLYVATGDGALHAIGARTGAHRWTYRTQGEIVAEPIPKGDTVFLASTDFGIYAIRD